MKYSISTKIVKQTC